MPLWTNQDRGPRTLASNTSNHWNLAETVRSLAGRMQFSFLGILACRKGVSRGTDSGRPISLREAEIYLPSLQSVLSVCYRFYFLVKKPE